MTEKENYRILVVDDHPLFRRGVRELLCLDPGIEVVGEAGTREEAVELARKLEPDLTVLDLNMKGSSGVEILTLLKEEDPSRRVVILTVSDSGEDLTACIRAGADGYFLKDMEPERFLEAVRRTLEGQLIVAIDGGVPHGDGSGREVRSDRAVDRARKRRFEARGTGLYQQRHRPNAGDRGRNRQGAREAPTQETRLQKPCRSGVWASGQKL